MYQEISAIIIGQKLHAHEIMERIPGADRNTDKTGEEQINI